MANRNPITTLRHDPLLEIRNLAAADIHDGAEPGWYAIDAVVSGAKPKTIGPFTSRGEAIVEQGRQELAKLPSIASWRPGHIPFERIDEAGPRIHDPLIVIGDASLFRLAATVRIDSIVKLEIGAGLYLGAHVHIASFAHIGIGGGVAIFEEGSSAGSGVRVITGSNVYGAGHGCSAVAPDAKVARSFVRVCRNAVLFAGATVLPGVTIGQNAVVAAGSVVLGDVPPFEVWAGNPARFVKRMEWSVSHQ